jgi:hypothetical protein
MHGPSSPMESVGFTGLRIPTPPASESHWSRSAATSSGEERLHWKQMGTGCAKAVSALCITRDTVTIRSAPIKSANRIMLFIITTSLQFCFLLRRIYFQSHCSNVDGTVTASQNPISPYTSPPYKECILY